MSLFDLSNKREKEVELTFPEKNKINDVFSKETFS